MCWWFVDLWDIYILECVASIHIWSTIVHCRKTSTRKEESERRRKKPKVNIHPWSNVDCLCLMLSFPISQSHLWWSTFQPKVDILGSMCVCVCADRNERWGQPTVSGRKSVVRRVNTSQWIKYRVAKLVFCITYSYSLLDLFDKLLYFKM